MNTFNQETDSCELFSCCDVKKVNCKYDIDYAIEHYTEIIDNWNNIEGCYNEKYADVYYCQCSHKYINSCNASKTKNKIDTLCFNIFKCCQFSCKRCASWWVRGALVDCDDNPIDFSYKIYKTILPKIPSYITNIGLDGCGEITILFKKYPDLISLFPNTIKEIILMTNGLLDVSDILEPYKDRIQLMISMHAYNREQFMEITGFDGYDIVMNNIKKYHENGFNIKINTVVMKENMYDINAITTPFLDNGIPVQYTWDKFDKINEANWLENVIADLDKRLQMVY